MISWLCRIVETGEDLANIACFKYIFKEFDVQRFNPLVPRV